MQAERLISANREHGYATRLLVYFRGKPNRTGFPSKRTSPTSSYAFESLPKWRTTEADEGRLASSLIKRAEINPQRSAKPFSPRKISSER